MAKHRPSQCPSLWPLGSCNNSWTTGRSDCIQCVFFQIFLSFLFLLLFVVYLGTIYIINILPIWLYEFRATNKVRLRSRLQSGAIEVIQRRAIRIIYPVKTSTVW